MFLRSASKNLFQIVSHYFGFNWLVINYLQKVKKVKTTLNYHHILPRSFENDNLRNGYAHSLTSFERQICYLSKHFQVDLDFNNNKSITITFDDGALNNYNYAIPILDKYNIKAWFFINDRHSDKSDPLWIDFWYAWFDFAPEGNYSFCGQKFKLEVNNRRSTESELFKVCIMYFSNIWKNLDELKQQFDPSSQMQIEVERFQPMSREHLQSLIHKGHKIGYHTANHLWLSALNDDELKAEMNAPNHLIDLGMDKTVLSIPFGFPKAYNETTVQVAEDLGYTSILLNHADGNGNLVGRINLPDSPNTAQFVSHLAQLPQLIRSLK